MRYYHHSQIEFCKSRMRPEHDDWEEVWYHVNPRSYAPLEMTRKAADWEYYQGMLSQADKERDPQKRTELRRMAKVHHVFVRGPIGWMLWNDLI